MSDLILSAQKLKYDTYKKNEEEFLKTANIDPVFVLSTAARETQSKLLDQFNNKWGAVMKQKGGNLSTDDKVNMSKERDFIIMNQQKMQSDMTQAFAAKDAVSKDIQGNLDHQDFQRRWDSFISTGDWEQGPLLPSSVDPDEFFGKDVNKGNFGDTTVSKTVLNPDKTLTTKKFESTGTEQDGRNLVASYMHGNDRMARGWIEKFQQLKTTNPQEYKKYIEEGNNPILRWAQDNYWDKVLKTKEITEQKPVLTGKKGGIDIDLFGRHYANFQAGQQRNGSITYADKTYNNPIEFDGTAKISYVPTTGGIKLGARTSRNLTSKGNIEGYLKAYDPDGDKIIIAATGTDPNIDNGTLLEIPAGNLNKAEIDKIPIVVNGQTTNLGTLRNKAGTPQEKPKINIGI
jgi:hypothetical protein